MAKGTRKSHLFSPIAVKQESISKYLIQELYLCAELCMDRNYVGITTIERLFSYETLVTILCMNVNVELKAAAANLIVFLYIDKNPQFEVPIPNLSRTWGDISKNRVPALPYVDANLTNKFSILQQLCIDHIKDIVDATWTPYSCVIMKLLYSLVRFNFYGCTERLVHIIHPLLSALDRRRITAYEPKKVSKYSSKEKEDDDEKLGNSTSPPKIIPKDKEGSVRLSEIEMLEKGSQAKIELQRSSSFSDLNDIEERSGLENANKEKLLWTERILLVSDSFSYLVILLFS